ncbi:MAG: outer membrane protein assembly factor BamD, partial [Kiritimatiellaceae bacterium]|nr:outer membrane protein assembly factor BamD [Kiritimatiellaceae bacterium]
PKKSFTAYEELIKQYYTSIKDYDAILDQQYELAYKEMTRKRLRWLFGGYRAPERAVPLYESILQNAPQWNRAPEMQYMIGQAYQKNDDPSMAVVAYSTVEYRYPNSPYAEKAATSKLDSYKALVEDIPYSESIREQAKLSSDLFLEMYPKSSYCPTAEAFGVELHNLAAKHTYEIGEFYERIPRPPKKNSAALYYNKVTNNYPTTTYATTSANRLRVLLPGGDVMLADGTKAPIGSETNGTETSAAVAGGTATGSNASASSSVAGTTGSNASTVETRPLPERTTTDDKAIEITADRLEYVGDLLVGEGNVSVQQKGTSLQADKVVVNHETGEIKANGNIKVIREGSRWEGQELVYNYKTKEGTFGKSFLYFEPAYITAESTERISTNEVLLRNATITTCSGDNPAVHAKAKQIRILDENKPSGIYIDAKDVTFYTGPVPIFYTPIWRRHLGQRIFSFKYGYSSDMGAFVLSSAELHPTDWLTSKTHVDGYSERGVGVGQDFKWKSPTGRGAIETYFINDSDPHNDNDYAGEDELIDRERYRVRLTHREDFNPETYLATKVNKLSDPGVTRDFFEDEYREAVNPENYTVVQRSTEDYAASVRVDQRMDDFYTAVNRLPEVTYDKYRTRVGDSPFFFESENNASFLQQKYGETNVYVGMTNMPSDYESARMDTHNQVFLPLRFKDFFNVIPRAGHQGTWYSDTVDGDADLRNMLEAGTLTSFKSYKTMTEKSGFFGTGLRHTVEP